MSKVSPMVVAYGAGTNSTAVLVGLHEQKIRPDHIVFADTGGEKPQTYEYLQIIDNWCKAVNFPPLTIVKGAFPQQVIDGSLEAECLRLGVMPSKTFGYGSCSQKWKIDASNRWAKNIGLLDDQQNKPVKMIGFDFDEPDRADKAQDEKGWIKRFPLMEWFWGREDCIAAIDRAGLIQPGKSACFFCPSSKKHEILNLPPDLLERALEMERLAMSGEKRPIPTNVKGLGRQWSWRSLVDYHAKQMSIADFVDPPPIKCNCYDG